MKKNVRTDVSPMTFEGTPAMPLTNAQALRRTVASCLLWENQFYESGEAIAERIKRLTLAVTPAEAAEIASEARTMFKLRHAPLWIARWLAAGTPDQKAVVAGLLESVIQRPDEITEFLALYWENGKTPIAASAKRGLARAFGKFSAYSLAKYRGEDGKVSLRDAMFLVHPKPVDASEKDNQTETFKALAEKTLMAPDTWEVALSSGADKKETWERLLTEKKLGALALIRNLRNMISANVPLDMIKWALSNMNVERVLPFRFITAERYAPTLRADLEAAMYRCLDGTPKLAGRTALVIDTSPSMWHAKVSAKSEMDRFDAAAALAMLAREICDDVKVYAFNSQGYRVEPLRGFALRNALLATQGSASCGGAAVQMANEDGYDRIIVLTDGEWHDYIPTGGARTWSMHGRPARDVIPAPLTRNAYLVNVASQTNAIGSEAWVMLDGWSEAIITYIQAIELINRRPVATPAVAGEEEVVLA